MRSWSDEKVPPVHQEVTMHLAFSSRLGICARMFSTTARSAIGGQMPTVPGSGPDLAARHRSNQALRIALSALLVVATVPRRKPSFGFLGDPSLNTVIGKFESSLSIGQSHIRC
jgi:hypothetical protein